LPILGENDIMEKVERKITLEIPAKKKERDVHGCASG
jgi:hypothetical protein